MKQYVIIYTAVTEGNGEKMYLRNQTYYVTGMDALAVWLQDNPDAIINCIAQVLE